MAAQVSSGAGQMHCGQRRCRSRSGHMQARSESGQVRCSQARSGAIRYCRVRSGQIRCIEVKSSAVWSGQDTAKFKLPPPPHLSHSATPRPPPRRLPIFRSGGAATASPPKFHTAAAAAPTKFRPAGADTPPKFHAAATTTPSKFSASI